MCILKISAWWMQYFFCFVYCSTSGCQGQCCGCGCSPWVEDTPSYTWARVCCPRRGAEPERHKRLSVSKKSMNGAQVRPQRWGYSRGSSRRKKICQQKSRKRKGWWGFSWRKCLCTEAEPLRAWVLVSAGFEAFAKSINKSCYSESQS